MSHRLRPSRLSSYRQGWRDNNNNPGAWQQTRVDLDWIFNPSPCEGQHVLLGRTRWSYEESLG